MLTSGSFSAATSEAVRIGKESAHALAVINNATKIGPNDVLIVSTP
jgi:hypothetical protein